jgi:serine/threonine-protein kinase HipA
VAGLDDHDLDEHICLDAARRAGLIAVRTHVERFGQETAIVVDRYDRRESVGQVNRVQQEDLCQALGLPPTMKYQNDGGPSPGQISDLFRRVMSPRVADQTLTRFVDALAWNWLIAGTDAHAKNYSLLLAGGQVRLAPLYDIASALPYEHDRGLRFAMKIGGDYRVFFYNNPLGKAADELGLDGEVVIDRVRKLANLVADAVAEAAAAPDIVALKRALPARLVDLVADRAKRCAQLVEFSRGADYRHFGSRPAIHAACCVVSLRL